MLKRVLRCWWGNDISTMSENRKRCYDSILANSGIEHIETILPSNYKEYEVAEHPYHESFEYLSEVHKGDYLRAYITYFYGGCWIDVKYIDHDWNQYFDLFEQHPEKIGIGYQQMIIRNGAYIKHEPGYLHEKCIAMTNFIFREKTELFYKYLTAMEKVLDSKLDLLKAHPGTVYPTIRADAHLFNNYKRLPEHLKSYPYPLRWMEISGKWFNAQLPYLDKIMYGMPPSHNYLTGYDHR